MACPDARDVVMETVLVIFAMNEFRDPGVVRDESHSTWDFHV